MSMQLNTIKTVLAVIWVAAVCLAGVILGVNSVQAWALLTAGAVVPPVVMLWRWNDPPQTMSERIQAARR